MVNWISALNRSNWAHTLHKPTGIFFCIDKKQVIVNENTKRKSIFIFVWSGSTQICSRCILGGHCFKNKSDIDDEGLRISRSSPTFIAEKYKKGNMSLHHYLNLSLVTQCLVVFLCRCFIPIKCLFSVSCQKITPTSIIGDTHNYYQTNWTNITFPEMIIIGLWNFIFHETRRMGGGDDNVKMKTYLCVKDCCFPLWATEHDLKA